ncbi:hypothetical protein D3C83_225680 [compost metagenome]
MVALWNEHRARRRVVRLSRVTGERQVGDAEASSDAALDRLHERIERVVRVRRVDRVRLLAGF